MTALSIQQALAPVTHEGNPMIDARALHGWLGHRADQFQKWMQSRIDDYGFEEGEDFSSTRIKTGGRPRTDYLLTIDMAKELAMVERSKVGRMTRQYFIEMEKAARQMAAGVAPAEAEDIIPDAYNTGMALAERLTGLIREQQAFMTEQSKVMAALVERVGQTPNVTAHPTLKAAAEGPQERDYVSARDAYFLMAKKDLYPWGSQVSRAVSPIGQQLSEACKQKNISWREVDLWGNGSPTRQYPIELLREVFGY